MWFFFYEKYRKSFLQRKWNIFLSDKLPLRFYFFLWKKFTLYRIKFPSKLYHSPLYQFCFRLEHHLVAKFPSILFSCQILISFLRSSCPLFISPQFGVFLICGLPEVTSGVKVWHFLLVFWLWLCKHITKQTYYVYKQLETLVESCQLKSRKPPNVKRRKLCWVRLW